MKPGGYEFTARVVVQHHAADLLAELDGLTVALFISPPSPEGGNLHEIVAPGYERQPVEFVIRPGERTVRSRAPVRFAPVQEWPTAQWAGIFRRDGSLLAYGRLKTAPGYSGHDEVTIAASGILLKLGCPAP